MRKSDPELSHRRTLAIALLCVVIATSALSVIGHIGLAAGWWR